MRGRPVRSTDRGGATSVQPHIVPTEPQYPAGKVTLESGEAICNKLPLNLNYSPARDRSNEVQSASE